MKCMLSYKFNNSMDLNGSQWMCGWCLMLVVYHCNHPLHYRIPRKLQSKPPTSNTNLVTNHCLINYHHLYGLATWMKNRV